MPKILALAGSQRTGSFNYQLLRVACGMAVDGGADVTMLSLSDYEIPLFDQDLEASSGLPESVVRLKQQFLEHDALLFSCPEYNGSITPQLKNVIDWVSRPASESEPSLAAYRGKVAALVAASPGGLGGLRGLRHVREILSNLGVLVTPKQVALSKAHAAFTPEGALADLSNAKMLQACVDQLLETTAKLHA
ncbi:MAG: NAD(P)H-dependent oxidoreductase [Planctomycetota bacterium]